MAEITGRRADLLVKRLAAFHRLSQLFGLKYTLCNGLIDLINDPLQIKFEGESPQLCSCPC